MPPIAAPEVPGSDPATDDVNCAICRIPRPRPTESELRGGENLKEFPEEARRTAGFELRNIQAGLTPEKAKPYTTVGSGIQELVVDSKDGWNRVMYVAKYAEGIYVLHAFEKRSNKILKVDQAVIERAHKDLLQLRKP